MKLYSLIKIFTLLLLYQTAFAQFTNNWGELNPEAPPETKQMDFIIGEWKLKTYFKLENGSWYESTGELSAKYIMNGYGVLVEGRHPGREKPFYSNFFSNYNSKLEKWVGGSINTLGNRKNSEGEFKDGKFILETTGMLFGGRKGKNRSTYFNITENSFSLTFDSYNDETGEWKIGGYKSEATRVDGPNMKKKE